MTTHAPAASGFSPVEKMIQAWQDSLAVRDAQAAFHREAYEKRKGFYAVPLSFAHYQALGAYVDALDLRGEAWTREEDRHRAHRETFGTAFPGASAADLEDILAAHFGAMSRAYDAELGCALDDISL